MITGVLLMAVLSVLVLLCLLQNTNSIDEKSPYYQHLPDCTKGYRTITKNTTMKGIVCPMVKDETGFLSEWVAYHEMQGFNHIILYDNNSTLPLTEIQPWIDRGFLTIKRDWWRGKRVLFRNPKKHYYDMMSVKLLAEDDCKETAVKMGIEIFVSLDLDEYLMPSNNDMTVMDELAKKFNDTKRGFMQLDKLQFPPVPHIQEPISLLTIEAYQTRVQAANRMNYYTGVSQKVAIWLFGNPTYTNKTTEMLIKCCDFHGCKNYDFFRECRRLIPDEMWVIGGKHKPWVPPPHIHHYARSLEKYMLKQRTWDTASGHDSAGYDMYNFLDRTTGFDFDNSGIVWGCQLRALLWNRTGEQHYVRPGDFWVKNPEFGKTVIDPRKRGRFGNGFGKVLGKSDFNPYPPGETYQGAHRPYQPPPENDTKKS